MSQSLCVRSFFACFEILEQSSIQLMGNFNIVCSRQVVDYEYFEKSNLTAERVP